MSLAYIDELGAFAGVYGRFASPGRSALIRCAAVTLRSTTGEHRQIQILVNFADVVGPSLWGPSFSEAIHIRCMDPRFRVSRIAATPNPQQCIWAAMHQDYSEGFVAEDRACWPNERRAGEVCVKRLLAGERGHYGPLEHAQIVLNVGWFPHSVMQQARTHRVGISFDVQSGRYTSQRIIDAVTGAREMDEVFYLRPVGSYSDRQGKKYTYTAEQREADWQHCRVAAEHYSQRLAQGFAEEHARDLIPYAIRQHFVVSFSLRAFLHFLDLRAKLDAQLEIRQLCDLMWPHLQSWAPEIAGWYEKSRLHRARLAP